MDQQSELLIERHPPVLTIKLNRPEKLNALNIALVQHLLKTLQNAELDEEVHLIVLKGEGRVFSAGGDVEVMWLASERKTLEEVEHVTRVFQEVISTIRRSSKIYVSLVHGVAMGGGAGLALSADFVYATEDTRFGWPYASLGFSPDGGASYELLNALGRYKALETLVFNRQIKAKELLEKGMINAVFSSEEWIAATDSMLKQILDLPAALLTRLKRLIAESESVRPDQMLSLEYRMMLDSAQSPEHWERVKSFFSEKQRREEKSRSKDMDSANG